jgi:hypothetical protein
LEDLFHFILKWVQAELVHAFVPEYRLRYLNKCLVCTVDSIHERKRRPYHAP